MNDDNPAAIQQMPDAAATVPSPAQNPAEGVRVRMLGIHSPAQDGQSELTSYLAPASNIKITKYKWKIQVEKKQLQKGFKWNSLIEARWSDSLYWKKSNAFPSARQSSQNPLLWDLEHNQELYRPIVLVCTDAGKVCVSL